MFPDNLGLENLLDSQDIIKKWVEEAIVLTDIEMEPLFDVVAALTERVEACYVVGSLIMARLAHVSRSVNIAAIKDLYGKVCTLRTTLSDRGVCSAVRREPFIIYMLGKPGIGKSSLSHKTVINLLRDANINMNYGAIYTHPAGAKYWENVNQEPAMLMDDAFVLRSGPDADLEASTLMSLKSTCLFTPPIAECDRKKKRYAPELVYIHSNCAFPELSNMSVRAALYRRRDLMWEASMIEGHEPKDINIDFTSEQLSNVEHLRFRYHLCPSDSARAQDWSDYMTYGEFYEYTKNTFIRFRARMIESHANTISVLNAAAAEITAYPELSTMPLLDILKMYSAKSIFPDTRLYQVKTDELIAKHQGKDDEIIFDMNLYLIGRLSKSRVVWERKFMTAMFNTRLNKLFCDLVEPDLAGPAALELTETSECLELLEIFLRYPTMRKLVFLIVEKMHNTIVDSDAEAVAMEACTFAYEEYKKRKYDAKKAHSSEFGPGKLEEKDIKEEIKFRSACERAPDHVRGLLETTQIHTVAVIENSATAEVSTEVRARYEKTTDLLMASLDRTDTDEYKKGLVKYTPEMLESKLEDKVHRVCDSHIDRLYRDLEIDAMEQGRKILFGDSYAGLEEGARKNFYLKALERWGCPHFWAYNRRWVVKLTKCCMTSNDMPHFCTNPDLESTCSTCCAGNNYMPILGEWKDCKGCVRTNPKLLKVFRKLYITFNPGTVEAMASGETAKMQYVPPIIYRRPARELITEITHCVTETLIEVSNWLRDMMDKFFGQLAKVWRFLKQHKGKIFSFLGVCTILAGGFFLRRRCLDSETASTLPTGLVSSVQRVDKRVMNFKNTVSSTATDIGNSVKNYFIKPVTEFDIDPDNIEDDELQPDEAVHNIIASGDSKAAHVASRQLFRAKSISDSHAITGTASHQISHREVVSKRIVDNTIHLIALSTRVDGTIDTTSGQVSRALVLGDRFVLTVLHAWERWLYLGQEIVRCLVKDRHVDINLIDIKMSKLDDSSLCVLRFPCNFPQFKKIVPFLASEMDHSYRRPSEGTVICCGTYVKLIDCTIGLRTTNLEIDGVTGASQVSIAGLYEYRAQAPGMCGALLLGNNLNAPIIGMHIAGNPKSNIGYAEPLFRESFEFLFSDRVTDIMEPVYLEHEKSPIDLQSTIFPEGSVGPSMAHHSPEVTAIQQSFIHGYVHPKTEPAPLTGKDPRLPPGNPPLIRGCEKHGILTKNFPPDVMVRTKERLRTHLLAKCRPMRNVSPLQLTEQQAICGDTQLPFCDPLRWNSSEGYPFYKFRPPGVQTKKWLFNLEETPQGLKFLGYNRLLGNILDFKRSRRADGCVMPTIFVDCLKDARIPKAKVSQPGKTRIFSMSPVDYTIDFRIYFYDFISSYQTRRMDNFNSIGINVFSEEWNVLALALLRHPNICTGDYSNFGPGLNLEVARACLDIILDWYDYFDDQQSLEDKRTRACLLSELIGARHLCSDYVYKVVAGIPSGSPLTVVLNSLVNTFYLFAAWDMLSVE